MYQHKIVASCPRRRLPRIDERVRFTGNVRRRYRSVSAGCLQEKRQPVFERRRKLLQRDVSGSRFAMRASLGLRRDRCRSTVFRAVQF